VPSYVVPTGSVLVGVQLTDGRGGLSREAVRRYWFTTMSAHAISSVVHSLQRAVDLVEVALSLGERGLIVMLHPLQGNRANGSLGDG